MISAAWLFARLWAGKALRGAVGVFTRWPRECAIIALAVACAWLLRAERRTSGAFAAYRQSAEANVAALKAEKARIETAQAQITKDTNHATEPARQVALDAARRYAAANRCLQSPAVTTASPARDSVPGPATAAGSVEAPREAVAVAPEALDACTLNTVDLQRAYEWAANTWGAN